MDSESRIVSKLLAALLGSAICTTVMVVAGFVCITKVANENRAQQERTVRVTARQDERTERTEARQDGRTDRIEERQDAREAIKSN